VGGKGRGVRENLKIKSQISNLKNTEQKEKIGVKTETWLVIPSAVRNPEIPIQV
jgi:hypothetical protein